MKPFLIFENKSTTPLDFCGDPSHHGREEWCDVARGEENRLFFLMIRTRVANHYPRASRGGITRGKSKLGVNARVPPHADEKRAAEANPRTS